MRNSNPHKAIAAVRIGAERARAWRYYLSKPEGRLKPTEGESEIVTSDVSDVIDGIMPSLLSHLHHGG